MEKTNPLRMKIYGFLCALLLCLSWIPAWGQVAPPLDEKDFVVKVQPPNSECNLPGQLTIRYNGSVATFVTMNYDFKIGEDGESTTVDAPAVSAPVKLELPVSMPANSKIFIYVTAGTSSDNSYTSFVIEASPQKSGAVELHLVSTPAGNGAGTTGGIQASLVGPVGFTEATFYLYKKNDLNTVVAQQRTTRPYEGVTFFNLPTGQYVVKAHAIPKCTPTPAPANWKTDHFELESAVAIDPFNLITTGIPGRGTCTGGVKVELSKISGVQQVEYQVAKKADPNTVINTATVEYPKFTHTFVGLPVGDYILKATEKTHNSTATREFTVENDKPELKVEQVHGSFRHIAEGEIKITLPNTTAACPVKYTITQKDDDQKDPTVPFSPVVKENVTEETTVITGLPFGNYEVTAEYGGETKKAETNVPGETFGWVNMDTTPADKICEPTGSMKFDLTDSRYYATKTQILNKRTGALVREFTITANQQKVEVKNLFAGDYILRRIYEKNNEQADWDFTIPGPQLESNLVVNIDGATTTLCGDKPMVRVPVYFSGDGGIENAPNMQAFLNGATFEIRHYNQDSGWGEIIDKVVATGTMPKLKGNEVAYIETPDFGNKLIVYSRCGYPILEYGNTYYGFNKEKAKPYRFSPVHTFRGCGGTGTDVDLRVLSPNDEPIPLITYKVKKKGTDEVLVEYAMKEGVKTAIVANMQPGDYTVEWYAQCSPTQVHTDLLHVEDKVLEKKDAGYIGMADCGDDGSINIKFTEFANINAWRHELYRASDNKLIQTYGTGATSEVSFRYLAPGKYIVKSTPIVECGEITPGRFEVEVKRNPDPPTFNRLSFEYVERKTSPFKNEGKALYSASFYAKKAKWRVLDVVTGALINEGEALNDNVKSPNYTLKFSVDKLPHTYKIEIESPCGKYERIDTIPLLNEHGLPGFDISNIVYPRGKCGIKGSITVNSKLKAAGLPEKGTKIILQKLDNYNVETVDQITNPTSIIATHTFSGLEPALYRVIYYYNGMSSQQTVTLPTDVAPNVYEMQDRFYYGVNDKAKIKIAVQYAEPGTQMKLVVRESRYEGEKLVEIKHLEKTVPADQPYSFEFNRPNGESGDKYLNVEATILDGCHAGLKLVKTVNVLDQKFVFEVERNTMLCPNDGEITLRVPEAFQGMSQIHYEITKEGDDTYQEVVETKTPAIPKKVIGLQEGTYKIKARATLLKAGGDAEVFDAEQSISLYTSYGQPLYATARPDYMIPTGAACPNGRIGLNIENGRDKNYRVYLKSTPDEGELNPMREIFTDPQGDKAGKLWGEGLKPGKYSLVVKDGCMEREIPEAEIVELPNTPKITPYLNFLLLDERTDKMPNETRDSVQYYLRFDPSLFEEKFRPIAYRAFEVQVVAKGAQPDDKQWKSDWREEPDGRSYIQNYAKRFSNCDGADVLIRFKNCPSSVTRIPMTLPLHRAFSGIWTHLKCNTVQWTFLSGEIGHRYKIKVTRREDGVVVREKEVIFNSHEEYLQRDPELEFPSDKSYVIEMEPLDYCGDPLESRARYVNAIERKYKYEFEEWGYSGFLSDCDGRRFSFYGWTDCKLPMKYYAYEIEGSQETLVSESGNYVPYRWDSPYKFKKDKTYSIRVVEYGQPEDTKIELVKFTLKYKLPVKYEFPKGSNLASDSFCGSIYDIYKKSNDLNRFGGILNAKWTDNDPYVQPHRYVTIPHMTVVATQKAAPHRKFVATKVYRYYNGLRLTEWKEQLADGNYAKEAFAPDGEYSLVAKTECGDIPMDDDYIGRPTLDLTPSTVVSSCDGKFTVTPKGTLTYRGSTADAEIVSFYVDGDSFNTTRNWGESFDTYQREFRLIVNIKLKSTGRVCTLRWPFSMSNYVLGFDQSQSMSLFCTDSGKGIIHMALKGGQPPYTYKLMTPDEEELETKTVPGAVDFERGQLGQRFLIKATDNCGLTWIPQEVQIQDPAAVSSSMRGREQFCEGDQAVMKARSFPNVTYEWTLPNGTKVPGQELTFLADKNSSGVYTVDIHLTTCTVTLTGKYQVGIATLEETSNFPKKKLACAGESVLVEAEAAKGTLNGENAESDVSYEWETTQTPNDEQTWRTVYYQTGKNLYFTQNTPGVYYVRRIAKIGSCKAISPICEITLSQGVSVSMTPDEQELTIDHKNPFTLTAGIVTGNTDRTYQWQRSLNRKDWENVGTEETYTEENRYGNTVYYRRNISSRGCYFEGQIITVHFKKRRGAYINPQLRQRTYQD